MKFSTQEVFSSETVNRPIPFRRPNWIKASIPGGKNYSRLKNIIDKNGLHTVCQEARCPNIGECWNSGTATFMILGDVCTRSCGFCNVKTGYPKLPDIKEPYRVAEAVKLLGIKYAVITSVTRDDLFDGGAQIFSETIRKIRELCPETKVEVLVPDFKGKEWALNFVLDASPDVLNHNIETVPRLYPKVRPQADYKRSLKILEWAKCRGFITKSGIILGIGEQISEVIEVMDDLRMINCDILTIGQYLQPTKAHLPIERFVHPDEFKMLKEKGLKMGFKHVESGPMVRSSYRAEAICGY